MYCKRPIGFFYALSNKTEAKLCRQYPLMKIFFCSRSVRALEGQSESKLCIPEETAADKSSSFVAKQQSIDETFITQQPFLPAKLDSTELPAVAR